MACVESTLGLKPGMVPSSVAKRNSAAKDLRFLLTTKLIVLLNTLPVGAAVFTPAGAGIATAGAICLPRLVYSVERPVPLSETCHGPFRLCDSPQGLTRLLSRTSARFGRSETRFFC